MSNDHANDSKPRCRGVEMNHIAQRWDECCLWVSGLTLRLPDCSCTMAAKVQTDGPQYISDNTRPHGSCCAFVRHDRSFPKPDTEKHRMETVGVAEGQDNLQLRPQRARGRQRQPHRVAAIACLRCRLRTPLPLGSSCELSRPTCVCIFGVGDSQHSSAHHYYRGILSSSYIWSQAKE
jgi:hypothetical protein